MLELVVVAGSHGPAAALVVYSRDKPVVPVLVPVCARSSPLASCMGAAVCADPHNPEISLVVGPFAAVWVAHAVVAARSAVRLPLERVYSTAAGSDERAGFAASIGIAVRLPDNDGCYPGSAVSCFDVVEYFPAIPWASLDCCIAADWARHEPAPSDEPVVVAAVWHQPAAGKAACAEAEFVADSAENTAVEVAGFAGIVELVPEPDLRMVVADSETGAGTVKRKTRALPVSGECVVVDKIAVAVAVAGDNTSE